MEMNPHLTFRFSTALALSSFLCFVPSARAHALVNGEVYYEEKLLTNLLDGYVKEARPVTNPADTVNVSIQFSFVRIDDLIETTDTFAATVFIVQTWKDPRLRWNASEFGGVKQIRLPADRLWTPDIVLYNVATQGTPKARYEDLVVVTSDGSMIWVPMMTLYSTCPMELSRFPYDTQICTMVFGSWTHTASEMSVTFLASNESEVDVELGEDESSFPVHEHPQWDLVGNKARAKISKKSYSCCVDLFTLLTVTCQMARKPQFYRYLTVGPAAVIGLLVPGIFLLPARSQEKTTYGLLLLLCLSILIMILENAIPFSHGSLPLIASFYLGSMILTCFSILLSVLISNITTRGTRRKPLPAWIHSLFLGRLGLRRLLCVGDYAPVDNVYSTALRSDDTVMMDQNSESHVVAETGLSSGSDFHLKEIHRCIRFIMGKMAADDSYCNVNQEWEELGCVIDRCFFLVFFIFYLFTAVSLLT